MTTIHSRSTTATSPLLGADGNLGALVAQSKNPVFNATRMSPLQGSDGTVRVPSAGNNTVVQLTAREAMRDGRWQVTGYFATKVSTFSIESTATSRPRTADGYPLASQTGKMLIRAADGSVITDLAQAQRRTRELVKSGSLTAVSLADAAELAGATGLPKPFGAMNAQDRVQYLFQEAARRLPASAAAEVKAILTSPESLLIMGAFCAAQAVPFANVAALVVGTLLLGNDVLDSGGKMVDAVQAALSASSQSELVNASKNLAEALAHAAVSVGSAAVGNRAGKALKNATSREATSLRTLANTVESYRSGNATPEQLRRAAIVAMQEKRARTDPSKNAAAAIDPSVVQASDAPPVMPKLLQAVFGGRTITKSAADAFTARATAWATQESPGNPAGALERLAALPVSQSAMVRQTVLDQLTGSSVTSMKVLGSSEPMAARALSARRQRLADAIDRAYPDAQSQVGLLQQNAGAARTALLRQQAGAELGGATPLARAVEAQLKANGTGERDLVNLSSSPQARISLMKTAFVEQWRGSSGNEQLQGDKSKLALHKAIDGQLAGIPGALAKEQYLRDLSASGQTVARMTHGEADAGASVRKTPRQQTTVSDKPPSIELENKSEVPKTLKSVPGGFEINVAGLTANQRSGYQRLRGSSFRAAEINDITSTMMRSGVTGLAKNPKYLTLSADNLASLMHLINGIDDTTALHDVTHALLSNPKFKYGTSEWRENVGNTVANSFINIPKNVFEPFSWVTGADGRKTLRIDSRELASARKELYAGADRFKDKAFESNFVENSRNRTVRAVERTVFEINYMEGRGSSERYLHFRTLIKVKGQLPDSPAPDFEQKLAQGYAEFEARVLRANGQIKEPHEWEAAVEPIVRVLSEPAIKAYQSVPPATRRELAVDSIASILTAARFNPKVGIPQGRDAGRFSREWVNMSTEFMKQPGYLKTYLEVRTQVRKALADNPSP